MARQGRDRFSFRAVQGSVSICLSSVSPSLYKVALQDDILRRQRRGIEKTQQQEADEVSQQIARWLAVYHQATHPDDFDQTSMTGLVDKGEARDTPAIGEDEKPF